MSDKQYHDELEAALARLDADEMCQKIEAYANYYNKGGDWPAEHAATFQELTSCPMNDPDKALAYVILGSSLTDDAGFLGLLGCGLLEDILRDPSDELLERIVAEARKSNRFRWLLSNPFKIAIAPRAWEAIQKFRITGPHEEPAADRLPPRN